MQDTQRGSYIKQTRKIGVYLSQDTISRDREAADWPISVDWGTGEATEADDSSNISWELLLVEREVMLKGNLLVRGTATKPRENPTRQKKKKKKKKKKNK